MILLTVLLAADFVNTVTGVLHDVIPAMALLRSLIYVLASFDGDGVFLRIPQSTGLMLKRPWFWRSLFELKCGIGDGL
jgi:hypothetical protein